jgi:hypothetical protein
MSVAETARRRPDTITVMPLSSDTFASLNDSTRCSTGLSAATRPAALHRDIVEARAALAVRPQDRSIWWGTSSYCRFWVCEYRHKSTNMSYA